MVELVDTLDLGSSASGVGVQVPPTAPSRIFALIIPASHRILISHVPLGTLLLKTLSFAESISTNIQDGLIT